MTNKNFKDQQRLDIALIDAAAKGATSDVERLLEAQADVHAMSDGALRMAASAGHTETVKVLLNAGADVHARNEGALRKALENEHLETVNVLLAAGANMPGLGTIYQAALRRLKRRTSAERILEEKRKDGDVEYASWTKVPTPQDRCAKCGQALRTPQMRNKPNDP